DRRKNRRGKGRISLADASSNDFGGVDIVPASAETLENVANGHTPDQSEGEEEQYSPIVIRTKEFPADRITVDEAVDQMELVGHDFFLFVNAKTDKTSVVYRRKGWNYGVITLEDAN